MSRNNNLKLKMASITLLSTLTMSTAMQAYPVVLQWNYEQGMIHADNVSDDQVLADWTMQANGQTLRLMDSSFISALLNSPAGDGKTLAQVTGKTVSTLKMSDLSKLTAVDLSTSAFSTIGATVTADYSKYGYNGFWVSTQGGAEIETPMASALFYVLSKANNMTSLDLAGLFQTPGQVGYNGFGHSLASIIDNAKTFSTNASLSSNIGNLASVFPKLTSVDISYTGFSNANDAQNWEWFNSQTEIKVYVGSSGSWISDWLNGGGTSARQGAENKAKEVADSTATSLADSAAASASASASTVAASEMKPVATSIDSATYSSSLKSDLYSMAVANKVSMDAWRSQGINDANFYLPNFIDGFTGSAKDLEKSLESSLSSSVKAVNDSIQAVIDKNSSIAASLSNAVSAVRSSVYSSAHSATYSSAYLAVLPVITANVQQDTALPPSTQLHAESLVSVKDTIAAVAANSAAEAVKAAASAAGVSDASALSSLASAASAATSAVWAASGTPSVAVTHVVDEETGSSSAVYNIATNALNDVASAAMSAVNTVVSSVASDSNATVKISLKSDVFSQALSSAFSEVNLPTSSSSANTTPSNGTVSNGSDTASPSSSAKPVGGLTIGASNVTADPKTGSISVKASSSSAAAVDTNYVTASQQVKNFDSLMSAFNNNPLIGADTDAGSAVNYASTAKSIFDPAKTAYETA